MMPVPSGVLQFFDRDRFLCNLSQKLPYLVPSMCGILFSAYLNRQSCELMHSYHDLYQSLVDANTLRGEFCRWLRLWKGRRIESLAKGPTGKSTITWRSTHW